MAIIRRGHKVRTASGFIPSQVEEELGAIHESLRPSRFNQERPPGGRFGATP